MVDPKTLLIAACVLLLPLQVEEKPRARLQGYDGIALPGEEVILKAKLEKDDVFHLDLEDQKVVFSLGGKTIGTAITGERGIARLAYKPEEGGTYRIHVAIHPDSPYQGEEGEVLLQVVPKDRDLLVSDVDHTIADISWLKFLVTANEDVPPLADAPDVLQQLSARYQIIYLTARDDSFMKKTKEWMSLQELPRAPIIFWDFLGSPSRSRSRFKKEMIAKLKQDWPQVVVGIGDQRGDAEAYLENGLRAFILGDEENLPDGATRVSSWKEILTALVPAADKEQ